MWGLKDEILKEETWNRHSVTFPTHVGVESAIGRVRLRVTWGKRDAAFDTIRSSSGKTKEGGSFEAPLKGNS
jgi:hypothetical protein